MRKTLKGTSGLDVIAAIQFVVAIGLVVAIVGLWDWEDPFGSLVDAFFRALLTILFLAIGWGLWSRRDWARTLALIVHWPTFAGATALLPLCLYIHFLVPAKGIAVFHAFALLGVILLPPLFLVSVSTLWYLNRRMQECLCR